MGDRRRRRARSLTIKAVDRTLELDLEEKVVAWPGTVGERRSPRRSSASYGLATEVESTPAAPDPDVHVVIQRDDRPRRSSARWPIKWGYAVYLESRERARRRPLPPARSAGRPAGRARARVRRRRAARRRRSVDLVAGQQRAGGADPALSDTPQTGDSAGDDEAQGARSLGGQATVLLAPDDVTGEVEPLAAAQGLARALGLRRRASPSRSTPPASGRCSCAPSAPCSCKGLGSSLSGPLPRRARPPRARRRAPPPAADARRATRSASRATSRSASASEALP